MAPHRVRLVTQAYLAHASVLAVLLPPRTSVTRATQTSKISLALHTRAFMSPPCAGKDVINVSSCFGYSTTDNTEYLQVSSRNTELTQHMARAIAAVLPIHYGFHCFRCDVAIHFWKYWCCMVRLTFARVCTACKHTGCF